jgi:uncharacterized protein (TIGR02453 family)
MSSPFTPKTLAFLRALKRNNDREWFRARKPDYEAHVRLPMVAVIDQLAAEFARFAPEMIAEPRVSLYRIYRDTRFSEDKTPLKTHAAAHFPSRRLPKGEGAGLYFEIAPAWVWIGGGFYMPSTTALLAIREQIAAEPGRLPRILRAAAFTRTFGELQGERLTRVPRGFRSDHPAAEQLRYKQFIAGREYPAEFARSPGFVAELVRVFQAAMPLVRFLNAPLGGANKR